MDSLRKTLCLLLYIPNEYDATSSFAKGQEQKMDGKTRMQSVKSAFSHLAEQTEHLCAQAAVLRFG